VTEIGRQPGEGADTMVTTSRLSKRWSSPKTPRLT